MDNVKDIFIRDYSKYVEIMRKLTSIATDLSGNRSVISMSDTIL